MTGWFSIKTSISANLALLERRWEMFSLSICVLPLRPPPALCLQWPQTWHFTLISGQTCGRTDETGLAHREITGAEAFNCPDDVGAQHRGPGCIFFYILSRSLCWITQFTSSLLVSVNEHSVSCLSSFYFIFWCHFITTHTDKKAFQLFSKALKYWYLFFYTYIFDSATFENHLAPDEKQQCGFVDLSVLTEWEGVLCFILSP